MYICCISDAPPPFEQQPVAQGGYNYPPPPGEYPPQPVGGYPPAGPIPPGGYGAPPGGPAYPPPGPAASMPPPGYGQPGKIYRCLLHNYIPSSVRCRICH